MDGLTSLDREWTGHGWNDITGQRVDWTESGLDVDGLTSLDREWTGRGERDCKERDSNSPTEVMTAHHHEDTIAVVLASHWVH